MAKRSTPTELYSPEPRDETSSSDDQQKKSPPGSTKKESIKAYVTNVLAKHGKDDEQPTGVEQSEINIDTTGGNFSRYENISAFRQYQSNAEGIPRTDAQRNQGQGSGNDEDRRNFRPMGESLDLEDSLSDLNMDPNPIVEERESGEQVYKQKVYVRQLQPPTPQPVEIQVQEILIKPQMQKPPIHVRVSQREPRTPSPIIIKTAPPPQPPPVKSDHPIIYNKYIPPPKQPPQQIIIHRYPDLPPKPRPIVVEQWLPYKPAPRRVIKHVLPREALETPPPPRNIIISYSKPRALIEVELVRLPIVKIDPQAYQEMSANGEQYLTQHPIFQHERDYLSGNRSTRTDQTTNQIDWRI